MDPHWNRRIRTTTIHVHHKPQEGLQKNGTNLYDEEGPNDKNLQWKIGLWKSPP